MAGTYVAVVAVCGSSLLIGQGAISLSGARRWSWLAPAVGLALVAAICWATVRLPGGGATSAIAIAILAVVSALYLRGRLEAGGDALRAGAPVALGALIAVSLPFAVAGHFGILGTGFNPDMSQHLLAGDRLAEDIGSQLLRDGYPLGPHAMVVALHQGLGIGLVQGFSGLTMAVAVLASLTALVALSELPRVHRTAGALLIGLPYLVASYFAQGAFKEVMQALLVLAFVLALREASSNPGWRRLPLRFLPAGILAVGSVYVYSFPGLSWLAAAILIWAAVERFGGRGPSVEAADHRPRRPRLPAAGPTASEEKGAPRSAADSPPGGGSPLRAASLAFVVFLVGVLPELGRTIDFAGFETFDPNGPGLGNLFGQVSPFVALGIWPSGDFRVAPGDGAAPAIAFYLGAAFAAALLVYGVVWCWRRRETAVVAGLCGAAAIYVAARLGGTPYTAAKALEMVAPLATLAILLPLLSLAAGSGPRRLSGTAARQGGGGAGFAGPSSGARGALAAGIAYLLAAGGCSALVLANAPVGPTAYSTALADLRPLTASDSVLVVAPDRLLREEHGLPYIAWELRGRKVCVKSASEAGRYLPPGIRYVVTWGSVGVDPPFPDLRLRRRADSYRVWERREVLGGPSPCPLVEVRQARQGPKP